LRVFAVSDIHLDYEQNRRWLHELSRQEFCEDVLILAGDITDTMPLLEEGLTAVACRFFEVIYVPGNHELWVHRNGADNSLEQFEAIRRVAQDNGVLMEPRHYDSLSIVPLFGWYDYSFGQPSPELRRGWLDFSACRWPNGFDPARVTRHFVAMNEPALNVRNRTVISFSHFLPRIDLMPAFIPPNKRKLYPVLGSSLLEQQIRKLGSDIHIYGHSHVNLRSAKDGTIYLNNAFGYPHETRRTAKELVCVFKA